MSEQVHLAPPRSPAGPAGVVTVPVERLLQNWKEAGDRVRAYLEALGVPAGEREALAGTAVARALEMPWDAAAGAVAMTLRALQSVVEERYPAGTEAASGFLAWRVGRLRAGAVPGDEQLRATPPLRRRAMIPEGMKRGGLLRRLLRRAWWGSGAQRGPLSGASLRRMRRRLPWTRVAHRRRVLLLALVLVPTIIASQFMIQVLPHQGETWLEIAIAVFFGALFGWISIGFWTATLGFLLLASRRDRFAITRLDGASSAPLPSGEGERTAIVMPICEEPVDRVFAGLRATHRSLERTGALGHFDFFVLSDTAEPGTAVHEEEAWFEWCRATGGFGRIFYRRRKVRIARKSGNVADFCRRWGRRYRYMIMLDADSVMTGDTLVRLVQAMERHPEVGMIQTAPSAVNRRSLFARVQQFASRVYGPMFAAGLHYWQLGDGQYWGHNTIVRVAPFTDHCALPRLPGREPLGGEILSHDFVEAALLGRAGWSLWLAYDLGGSYEEVPSTLLEEMKRDRRWCQGNLQHLRLLPTEGLFGAHRALFLNGALSYVSALLWFTFLSLSTIAAVLGVLQPPSYFPDGPSLFPEWPVWRPDWALALVAVIGLVLFLPKVLSILLIALRGSPKAHAGVLRLTLSVFLEILLSSLLAPIRMVFHSRFVLTNLLGRTVGWRSQARDETETSWREAIRHHALDSIIASAWGGALFWLNPGYFWWVTPIIGALMLSVPTSVLTSRSTLGQRARRRGLFLIPEETSPPPELRDLESFQRAGQRHAAALPAAERDGFVRAAVDPYVNAVHRMLLGRPRSPGSGLRARRQALLERALAQGPAALGAGERRTLLRDPDLTDALHAGVWGLEDREQAARWGRPAGAARS